jgi:hypothetical protein
MVSSPCARAPVERTIDGSAQQARRRCFAASRSKVPGAVLEHRHEICASTLRGNEAQASASSDLAFGERRSWANGLEIGDIVREPTSCVFFYVAAGWQRSHDCHTGSLLLRGYEDQRDPDEMPNTRAD